MWKIEDVNRKSFKVGFSFTNRFIKNQSDILDAIRYIHDKKRVPYKTRKFAQKSSLRHSQKAQKILNQVLVKLSDKFWAYFNLPGNTENTQEGFDRFHQRLCGWFLAQINKARKAGGLDPSFYGNAQKMINIVFKYLVCFEDYEEYADLFSYCHIPIDNYILAGLNNPSILCKVAGIEKVPYTILYKSEPWYEFDKKTYLDLVKAYRKALGPLKDTNLSYLGLEFFLWAAVKTHKRCILPVEGSSVCRVLSFYGE